MVLMYVYHIQVKMLILSPLFIIKEPGDFRHWIMFLPGFIFMSVCVCVHAIAYSQVYYRLDTLSCFNALSLAHFSWLGVGTDQYLFVIQLDREKACLFHQSPCKSNQKTNKDRTHVPRMPSGRPSASVHTL